jgi:hypothetical protein
MIYISEYVYNHKLQKCHNKLHYMLFSHIITIEDLLSDVIS